MFLGFVVVWDLYYSKSLILQWLQLRRRFDEEETRRLMHFAFGDYGDGKNNKQTNEQTNEQQHIQTTAHMSQMYFAFDKLFSVFFLSNWSAFISTFVSAARDCNARLCC